MACGAGLNHAAIFPSDAKKGMFLIDIFFDPGLTMLEQWVFQGFVVTVVYLCS